jgi:hypothetical protein
VGGASSAAAWWAGGRGLGRSDGEEGEGAAGRGIGFFFACIVCIAAVGDRVFCFASAATVHDAKWPLPFPFCIALLDSV